MSDLIGYYVYLLLFFAPPEFLDNFWRKTLVDDDSACGGKLN